MRGARFISRTRPARPMTAVGGAGKLFLGYLRNGRVEAILGTYS